MLSFLNFFQKVLISFAAILLILLIYFQSTFINHDWIKPSSNQNIFTSVILDEEFSEKFLYLNTMSMLEEYFLSEIDRNKFTDKQSVIFADNLIRERFIHQNLNIRLQDNWFLYVFNFFSSHRNDSIYLSSLSPDYILKFKGAICNQQAIIFQQLMRAIKLDYQSVLFNIPNTPEPFGHFASAVWVENEWFFVDTNLEPEYDLTDKKVLEDLLSGDVALFNLLYPNNIIDEIPDGAIWVDYTNKNPAFYGNIFHYICYLISWYGWIVSIACYFLLSQIKKRFLKL